MLNLWESDSRPHAAHISWYQLLHYICLANMMDIHAISNRSTRKIIGGTHFIRSDSATARRLSKLWTTNFSRFRRSWDALDPSHPQYGLRELLGALGVGRAEVQVWPGAQSSAFRHFLITELMRPAETSESWNRPEPASLEHVTRADCATPHQEALPGTPGG